MPYNTRRKSLSLPSLGIHLPNGSRSSRSPSNPKMPAPSEAQPPPPKRVKKSHDSESVSPPACETAGRSPETKDDGFSMKQRAVEHTPPPSPGDSSLATSKVDTEGIHDDIVVAVIEQLEKTGNRPHLIKELATVLASTNESIANSANAAALISSRLSLYLKRPWTALAPCPIVKELIPVHPRKVFFYLANSPHQPLPLDTGEAVVPTTETEQLTPSVSVASNDAGDVDEELERERARLSPSPEVDLSNPEFDNEMVSDDLNGNSEPGVPPSQPGSFSSRCFQTHNHRLSHNHRAASPPLEGDEREFTQTASSVRERASAEDISGKAKLSPDNADNCQTEETRSSSMESGEEPVESQTQDQDYDSFPSQFVQDQDDDQQQQPQQQLDTVTTGDLFAPSHSPSDSSEVSSRSSATTPATEGGLESDFAANKGSDNYASTVLKGPTDITVAAGPAISATKVTAMQLSSNGSKDTAHVLKSKLQPNEPSFGDHQAELGGPEGDDIEMTDSMTMVKPVMGLSILDQTLESWGDLQSPETVEIHELDAIFADI